MHAFVNSGRTIRMRRHPIPLTVTMSDALATLIWIDGDQLTGSSSLRGVFLWRRPRKDNRLIIVK